VCQPELAGERTCWNLAEPAGHLVVLIFSHVDVDDGDRQERRQRYENHVETEVRTWHTQSIAHTIDFYFLAVSRLIRTTRRYCITTQRVTLT